MERPKFKFRAWHISTSSMIPPEAIEALLEGREIWIQPKAIDKSVYTYKMRNRNIFVDQNLSLMQYTGIEDRNGKEIFEGDILVNSEGWRGTVVWTTNCNCCDGVHGWGLDRSQGDGLRRPEGLEIVGNIFESPAG